MNRTMKPIVVNGKEYSVTSAVNANIEALLAPFRGSAVLIDGEGEGKPAARSKENIPSIGENIKAIDKTIDKAIADAEEKKGSALTKKQKAAVVKKAKRAFEG